MGICTRDSGSLLSNSDADRIKRGFLLIDSFQREFYEENGYLLLENLVSDEWLNRLRTASDTFVEKSRLLCESDKMLELEPEHSSESPRLRRLVSPVDHHKTFHEFAMSGPAAELALSLLGDPV